jgi:sterol desaturase/sphingolipid hydroxylase (fatty acid hydroxylase superfamily)
MSYSLSSNIVPVEWFLAELCPLNLYFCLNFKLSGLFFEVLWYFDLIFGMRLYLDELQFKFEFRSGRMTFGWVMTLELVFLFKFYVVRTFFDVLWYIDFIFGMSLYLDELQFKFEFRSGWMTFGWGMAIELIFFAQILSCPSFSLTSFDILTWYLVCGYI